MALRVASALVVSLLLLAVLAIQTAHGQSASVEQRQEKRILDCTLESTSFDDCDAMSYLIRVGVFSAPGLVIAILLLLACPLYCGGKYCCNCCGGRNQTPNFCCPNTELPARYSKGDIMRPKVLAIFCGLMTVAALAYGLIGATQLVLGLTDFTGSIKGIPDVITTEINAIDTALTVQRYTPRDGATPGFNSTVSLFGGSNTKTEAESARDEFKKLIDDNIGGFNTYIDRFSQAMFALFIVPSVVIFLGLLAACLNCRRYFPMVLVWLLFLFGFIVWLIHCIFSAFSMIIGDFCAEISGLAKKQLNLVAVLAQCQDSQFSGFKTAFRQMEVEQAEATCNAIQAQCYDTTSNLATNLAAGRIYNCPAALSCTGMTFATLVDLINTVFYVHADVANAPAVTSSGYICRDSNYLYSCTIPRCSDSSIGCTSTPGVLSDAGEQALGLWSNFLAAKTVSNTIDTLGARFSTCDSMMSIVMSPFDAPCESITAGLVYDRQATGLLGLCMIGGIFIFAWGAKRFIPLDQAEIAQTDGNTPVEELQG